MTDEPAVLVERARATAEACLRHNPHTTTGWKMWPHIARDNAENVLALASECERLRGEREELRAKLLAQENTMREVLAQIQETNRHAAEVEAALSPVKTPEEQKARAALGSDQVEEGE